MAESKALQQLASIDRSLAAMSGLLRLSRMSVQEKLEGLAAYERWRADRG